MSRTSLASTSGLGTIAGSSSVSSTAPEDGLPDALFRCNCFLRYVSSAVTVASVSPGKISRGGCTPRSRATTRQRLLGQQGIVSPRAHSPARNGHDSKSLPADPDSQVEQYRRHQHRDAAQERNSSFLVLACATRILVLSVARGYDVFYASEEFEPRYIHRLDVSKTLRTVRMEATDVHPALFQAAPPEEELARQGYFQGLRQLEILERCDDRAAVLVLSHQHPQRPPELLSAALHNMACSSKKMRDEATDYPVAVEEQKVLPSGRLTFVACTFGRANEEKKQQTGDTSPRVTTLSNRIYASCNKLDDHHLWGLEEWSSITCPGAVPCWLLSPTTMLDDRSIIITRKSGVLSQEPVRKTVIGFSAKRLLSTGVNHILAAWGESAGMRLVVVEANKSGVLRYWCHNLFWSSPLVDVQLQPDRDYIYSRSVDGELLLWSSLLRKQ
ncbi:unnamed protein product [Amoebophrya sp. A25]|nr:unnamed protein product [Amoebophrya sp. A25]|eukprot:GSA25T00011385001.1